jgi:phosphatidylglycerol:prolipoprotein diacylglycerol transferase
MMPRLTYALFMGLALAVFLLARRLTPTTPELAAVPRWQRVALGLAAFVGGTLGAKLPFIGSDLSVAFNGGPWLSDGKTIVAGLMGAYMAVECAKWVLGITAKTGDSFAIPLALAMAVGRWGCFCNGCCYGVPTSLPWGVTFGQPDGTAAVCHPTQIYESLFHVAAACALIDLTVRGRFPRQRLKLYLIAYGVFRFCTEFIRPEPAFWLGLTFYQWACLVMIGGLVIQWWVDRRPAAAIESVDAERVERVQL